MTSKRDTKITPTAFSKGFWRVGHLLRVGDCQLQENTMEGGGRGMGVWEETVKDFEEAAQWACLVWEAALLTPSPLTWLPPVVWDASKPKAHIQLTIILVEMLDGQGFSPQFLGSVHCTTHSLCPEIVAVCHVELHSRRSVWRRKTASAR